MNNLAKIYCIGLCFVLISGTLLRAQYAVGEKIEAEDLAISGVEYDCLVTGHGEGWIIEGFPEGYTSDYLYAISGNSHWLCGDYDPDRMPPRCETDESTGDDHCCDKYVSIPIDIPEAGDYVIYAYVMNFPDSACLTDNRGCGHKSKWESDAWHLTWDDVGLLDKIADSGGNMAVAGPDRKYFLWMTMPYEKFCGKFGLDMVTLGKDRADCPMSSPVGCDFPAEVFALSKGLHTIYLKVAYEFTCIDWLMVVKNGDPAPTAEPGRSWQETDVENPITHSPESFVLEQNYPNPFNACTIINYYLPRTSNVNLLIYNIAGQEIDVLVDTRQSRGHHSVTFDASELPSGTYIYRLDAYCSTCGGELMNLFSEKREMTLIK